MARRAGLRVAEAFARRDRSSATKCAGIGPSYSRSSSVRVFVVMMMSVSRGHRVTLCNQNTHSCQPLMRVIRYTWTA